MGLQQLLNRKDQSQVPDFEELLFWGKIIGTTNDYYVAMGVNYQGMYEFPVKVFYWASSTDFTFKPFPQLNDQHGDEYNKIKSLITGIPSKVHKKVEPEKTEGEEEEGAG